MRAAESESEWVSKWRGKEKEARPCVRYLFWLSKLKSLSIVYCRDVWFGFRNEPSLCNKRSQIRASGAGFGKHGSAASWAEPSRPLMQFSSFFEANIKLIWFLSAFSLESPFWREAQLSTNHNQEVSLPVGVEFLARSSQALWVVQAFTKCLREVFCFFPASFCRL